MARKQGSHSTITGPKVFAAARDLIAQHGFAAVSMRQIAREVGVQAGALYLYTPDKQTLLFELMRSHMEELLTALPAQSGGFLEQLQNFTEFHLQFHLARPELVFISYMELRNLNPENFAIISQMRKSYEDRLEAILAGGDQTQEFVVPDTKLATMAVIAMLNGVNTWYRPGGRLALTDVEAIYFEMVRHSVGA
ncbi:transcriptional regulator, TetR family protein [Rhodobacterales bacterium HTCC2150]|nr:transcriptional regulator, TetR family protein [Rhodobacterales bacterium HTCC2150] [Rhodobacteraceae bacterium HTCC2150]